MQLLNLLDALETRGLSFTKVSVHNLIIQSLWQLGNDSKAQNKALENTFYSYFHAEYADRLYDKQMLKILKSCLESIKKKWDDHQAMATLVSIDSRLLTIVPDTELKQKFQHF